MSFQDKVLLVYTIGQGHFKSALSTFCFYIKFLHLHGFGANFFFVMCSLAIMVDQD